MDPKSLPGGPAFPISIPGCGDNGAHGMSLRDYFAAKALHPVYAMAMQEAREGSGLFMDADWRVGLALDAYAMADAMLKARRGAQ